MKTNVMITILIYSVFLGISSAQADVVWTEGYHELNTGDSHEHVGIYNDVQLNIYGGATAYLHTYDSTLTNWYSGIITHLWARNNSTVNIFGGNLNFLYAAENSKINLSAYDVVINSTGGWYNQGYVFGKFYINNRPFYFDLSQESYLHIKVIPEPATVLIFGLGGMAVLRRKKLRNRQL